MPKEITTYETYDGSSFNTLEEANRYETTAFNRWIVEKGFKPFLDTAGTREKTDNYETQRDAREHVLRELFEYQEAKK